MAEPTDGLQPSDREADVSHFIQHLRSSQHFTCLAGCFHCVSGLQNFDNDFTVQRVFLLSHRADVTTGIFLLKYPCN